MDAAANTNTLRKRIWTLYEGNVPAGHRFRYALLIFDLATVAFIIATSFLQWQGTKYVDVALGVLLLFDFAARLFIAKRPWRMVFSSMASSTSL